MLNILYLLVPVIVTCETRFRHLGKDYEEISGCHLNPLPDSRKVEEQPVSENSLPNTPFHFPAPAEGEKEEGRYPSTCPLLTKLLVSNKDLLESKESEITPHSSNIDLPGCLIINFPSIFAEKLKNEREPIVCGKSLPVSQYPNPNKVDFDPKYRVYKGFQIVRRDHNSINVYSKTPYGNFKTTFRIQTNVKGHPCGITLLQRPPKRSLIKQEANQESGYVRNGYLGVRFALDDSSVQDDFSDQDDYTQNLMDIKKRFGADYY